MSRPKKILTEEELEEKRIKACLSSLKHYYAHHDENIEKMRNYYSKNKEKENNRCKEYYMNNREEIIKQKLDHNKENKERINTRRREYRLENIESEREKARKIYHKTKDQTRNKRSERAAKYRKQYKDKMFLHIGRKCAFCGETDENLLTLDHIKQNGSEERKVFKSFIQMLRDIERRDWSVEYINENYQILCYNCHEAKDKRAYFDLPYSEKSYHQRYQHKLWKEAFEFFGPCELCGDKDLKHITIDHKLNNGAEMRKNGERQGSHLLSCFRKMEWPELLKDTYRILCWNCNCRKDRAVYRKNNIT